MAVADLRRRVARLEAVRYAGGTAELVESAGLIDDTDRACETAAGDRSSPAPSCALCQLGLRLASWSRPDRREHRLLHPDRGDDGRAGGGVAERPPRPAHADRQVQGALRRCRRGHEIHGYLAQAQAGPALALTGNAGWRRWSGGPPSGARTRPGAPSGRAGSARRRRAADMGAEALVAHGADPATALEAYENRWRLGAELNSDRTWPGLVALVPAILAKHVEAVKQAAVLGGAPPRVGGAAGGSQVPPLGRGARRGGVRARASVVHGSVGWC